MSVPRVKDGDIIRLVNSMQDQGMDVGLDNSYNQFRVTTRNESRDLSPRAPNRQIQDWLFAYREGWNAHKAYTQIQLREWVKGGDSAMAELVEGVADGTREV